MHGSKKYGAVFNLESHLSSASIYHLVWVTGPKALTQHLVGCSRVAPGRWSWLSPAFGLCSRRRGATFFGGARRCRKSSDAVPSKAKRQRADTASEVFQKNSRTSW